ncbi:MAG: carbohydrate kinase [Desulfuromonas sp.]|nr:carbohydrate kinase [Desulfuromonas sp.]
MNKFNNIYIFGEVLFDCFPSGEQILGGAPFNVAWHLQALGDNPNFISRIGTDAQGDKITQAMQHWGLNTELLQLDPQHPTGRVEVRLNANEPSYDIVAPSAYDFIAPSPLPHSQRSGILYHGTLGVRNTHSRSALHALTHASDLKIFLDINLRSPWWQQDEVFSYLNKAQWAKMNQDELGLLGYANGDLHHSMAELQTRCQLEQLIVTRGAQGALIRTASGEFHNLVPKQAPHLIDTVGAGDAFSAIYIHGLCAGWPIDKSLHHAQEFATKIIGIRGATTSDLSFYLDFVASLA